MPAGSRLGDLTTGHGCFPPQTVVESSSTVFYDDIGAARETDGVSTHCCGSSCHDSTIATGSKNVFIDNLPAARIADPVNCGSAMAQGSRRVIIG